MKTQTEALTAENIAHVRVTRQRVTVETLEDGSKLAILWSFRVEDGEERLLSIVDMKPEKARHLASSLLAAANAAEGRGGS